MGKPTKILLTIIISIIQIGNCFSQDNNQKLLNISSNGNNFYFPYYINTTKNKKTIKSENLIIVIHGMNRNGRDYFNSINKILSKYNNNDLIVAPIFSTKEDLQLQTSSNKYLFWSSGGWKSGSNTKNRNPICKISSYEVLSRLLDSILNRYTQIKSIKIIGHSAGGQFVQRFASCHKSNLKIKYIVANPSSYLYFNNKRFNSKTKTFNFVTDKCLGFNDWKYSLENLYNFPSRQGIENIKNNYRLSEVYYLLGELDNSTTSKSLDKSCKANLQGTSRLDRGKKFRKHLIDEFRDSILENHKFNVIPKVGHNHYKIFNSKIAVQLLLD